MDIERHVEELVGSPRPHHPRPTGLTILVVEDDADTRDALSVYLTHCGARVLLVPDGNMALDLLTTHEVDVSLCDLQVANMTGREFVQRLRSTPALAHQVVIAVTGYERYEASARADGFDACLIKPVTWDAIMSAIQAARGSAQRRK